MLAIEVRRYPYHDHRGTYANIWDRRYEDRTVYAEDDISISKERVLRGIHVDPECDKLVTCLYGKVYVVIVDPQTKEWESHYIKDADKSLFVPRGLGIAHLVLSPIAIWHYKQSNYYDPKRQTTIKWNDPEYNIWWPIDDPILSRRDQC